MEVSRLNAEVDAQRAEYEKLQFENARLRCMLAEALQSKTTMEMDYKKEIEEMQYVLKRVRHFNLPCPRL